MLPISKTSALSSKAAHPASGSSDSNGWFHSFVALCQALAWPLVVVVLFL